MLLFSLNNLNETGNSAEPTQRSSPRVHLNAAKLLYLSLKPSRVKPWRSAGILGPGLGIGMGPALQQGMGRPISGSRSTVGRLAGQHSSLLHQKGPIQGRQDPGEQRGVLLGGGSQPFSGCRRQWVWACTQLSQHVLQAEPLQTLSNVDLKAPSPRRNILAGGGPRRRTSSLHSQHLSPERTAPCVTSYTHAGISHTGINGTRLERQCFKPVCVITWYPIPAKTQPCVRINVRIYTFQCLLSITEASLPGVQSKALNLIIRPYEADAPFIPFSQG